MACSSWPFLARACTSANRTVGASSPLNRDALRSGWTMALPDAVKRHAIQSMRLHEGDALQISDGAGLRIDATVADERAGTVLVESFT